MTPVMATRSARPAVRPDRGGPEERSGGSPARFALTCLVVLVSSTDTFADSGGFANSGGSLSGGRASQAPWDVDDSRRRTVLFCRPTGMTAIAATFSTSSTVESCAGGGKGGPRHLQLHLHRSLQRHARRERRDAGRSTCHDDCRSYRCAMRQSLGDDSELKASEDRFATSVLLESRRDGDYDAVRRPLPRCDGAFERQMGYKRDEICGHTSLELAVWPTPGDREVMVATLLRRKTLREVSAQFRTKSGELITTLYSAGLIAVEGAECVPRGDRRHHGAEAGGAALRESESKFRMLAETTQSGILIYRQDGRLCYFNPQVPRFTGYAADELHGMTVWDLIPPDVRDFVRSRAQARWRGEQVSDRYQFTILTKSGDTRWLDLSAQLIPVPGRGRRSWARPSTSPTPGAASRQAQEHAALLQTLIANSPYGIMMGGKDHRIRFCNSAFQRIFQYSEDEVIGNRSRRSDWPHREQRGRRPQRTRAEGRGRASDGRAAPRRTAARSTSRFHAVPLMADGEFVGLLSASTRTSPSGCSSEAKLRALRDRLTRVQDEEARAFRARAA